MNAHSFPAIRNLSFNGYKEALARSRDQSPRLIIDGQPYLPLRDIIHIKVTPNAIEAQIPCWNEVVYKGGDVEREARHIVRQFRAHGIRLLTMRIANSVSYFSLPYLRAVSVAPDLANPASVGIYFSDVGYCQLHAKDMRMGSKRSRSLIKFFAKQAIRSLRGVGGVCRPVSVHEGRQQQHRVSEPVHVFAIPLAIPVPSCKERPDPSLPRMAPQPLPALDAGLQNALSMTGIEVSSFRPVSGGWARAPKAVAVPV